MKNARIVMNTWWKQGLLAALVGLGWLGLTGRTEAKTWATGTSGLWETPANWSPATAPASGDVMQINPAGAYTVSVANSTADTAPATLGVFQIQVGNAAGTAALSVNFTNATQALSAPSQFWIGLGGGGTLTLSAGTISGVGLLVDGAKTGTVNVTGGTIWGPGQIGIGSMGIWNVSGGNSVWSSAIGNNCFFGVSGSGSFGQANISGGSMAITNNGAVAIWLGNQGRGEINISGGTFLGDSLNLGNLANATGVVTMTGGSLSCTDMRIGNQTGGAGIVNLSGGTMNLPANAYLGIGSTCTGTVNMTGGTLKSPGNLYIGYTGVGTMTSSGGLFVGNNVILGPGGTAIGRWNITGGESQITNLTVAQVASANCGVVVTGPGVLQIGNAATLGTGATTGFLTNQTGGTLRFLTANPSITESAGSQIVVTNAAVEFKDVSAANLTGNIATKITYLGGNNTLRLNNSTNVGVASMTFDTNQTFSTLALINGNTRWQSTNLNVGTGGSLILSNTQARISSVFTNQGTFRSDQSTATFDSKVVNSGAWITDPSTNTFNGDYSLTSTGYVQMAAGDVYAFKSNFVNQSTQSNAYNTVAGKFLFNGTSVTQTFFTAGKDLGPEAGYTPGRTNNILPATVFGTGPGASNFALGTLEISNSSTVKVSDAFSLSLSNDDGQRAALYLDQLILDQNSWLIIDTNVTVYFRGSNDWAAANAGVSMLFDGELHQLVPEPSILLLWAGGLGLLGWLRRKPMNKSINTTRAITVVGLACLMWAGRSDAGQWTNTVGGLWETPNNYNPIAAPAGPDTITTVNGTYTISITNSTADTAASTMTISGLQLGAASGLPTLFIGYTNTAQALTVNGNLFVGINNNGQLNLSNGTVRCNSLLLAGGTVNVSGGSISGPSQLSVGTWNQTGGNTIWSSTIGNNMFLATSAGNLGTINLSGGGMGITNNGSVALWLGNNNSTGVINLSGTGSFQGDVPVLGNFNSATGIVTMAGNSVWTVKGGEMDIGGNQGVGVGSFTINGGTMNLGAASLFLGRTGSSTGTLTQNGGTMNSVGTVYIGYVATGTVNSTAGTFLGNNVNVGQGGTGVGRWNITGGESKITNLTVSASAGANGGVVVSGPGVLQIGNAATLGSGATTGFITNQTGGTLRFLTANPSITLANVGSQVVVTNAAVEFKDVGAANLTGNIATKITYLGGNNTLRLNNSTNVGVASMTFDTNQTFSTLALVNGSTRWQSTNLNVGSGGSLILSNTQARISAVFTNQGTFRSDQSTATFDSKVVNSGAWITDPSTNTFNGDYSLTSTGYVQMAAGDVYTFKSNFVNQSTQSNTYDTVAGKFLFNGTSVTQTFFTAGKDLGPEAGYTPGRTNNILPATVFGTGPGATNFALGTLEISNSSTVKVSDAFSLSLSNDDGQRAALYLDQLILDQNSWLIIDTNVTVYFRGSNDWAAANAGVSMLFDGELHQLVPEPSVLLLWASGLGVLGYWRRRSGRK